MTMSVSTTFGGMTVREINQLLDRWANGDRLGDDVPKEALCAVIEELMIELGLSEEAA